MGCCGSKAEDVAASSAGGGVRAASTPAGPKDPLGELEECVKGIESDYTNQVSELEDLEQHLDAALDLLGHAALDVKQARTEATMASAAETKQPKGLRPALLDFEMLRNQHFFITAHGVYPAEIRKHDEATVGAAQKQFERCQKVMRDVCSEISTFITNHLELMRKNFEKKQAVDAKLKENPEIASDEFLTLEKTKWEIDWNTGSTHLSILLKHAEVMSERAKERFTMYLREARSLKESQFDEIMNRAYVTKENVQSGDSVVDVGDNMTDLISTIGNDKLREHWQKPFPVLPEYEKAMSYLPLRGEWLADSQILRYLRCVTKTYASSLEKIKAQGPDSLIAAHISKVIYAGYQARIEALIQTPLFAAAAGADPKDHAISQINDAFSGESIQLTLRAVYSRLDIWQKPYFVHALNQLATAEPREDMIQLCLTEICDRALHCKAVQQTGFNVLIKYVYGSISRLNDCASSQVPLHQCKTKKTMALETLAKLKAKGSQGKKSHVKIVTQLQSNCARKVNYDTQLYEQALTRFYECVESFLDDHKEKAFKTAIREPSKFFLAMISEGKRSLKLTQQADEYAPHYYMGIINATLNVHFPMLCNYSESRGADAVVDFWHGMNEKKGWDMGFSRPGMFGLDYTEGLIKEHTKVNMSGDLSTADELRRSLLDTYGAEEEKRKEVQFHALPYHFKNIEPARLLANRAVHPSSSEDNKKIRTEIAEYLTRFAYFFRRDFLIEQMFHRMNAEDSIEFVGFRSSFEILFCHYYEEQGWWIETFNPNREINSYTDYCFQDPPIYSQLNTRNVDRFFVWLGVLKASRESWIPDPDAMKPVLKQFGLEGSGHALTRKVSQVGEDKRRELQTAVGDIKVGADKQLPNNLQKVLDYIEGEHRKEGKKGLANTLMAYRKSEHTLVQILENDEVDDGIVGLDGIQVEISKFSAMPAVPSKPKRRATAADRRRTSEKYYSIMNRNDARTIRRHVDEMMEQIQALESSLRAHAESDKTPIDLNLVDEKEQCIELLTRVELALKTCLGRTKQTDCAFNAGDFSLGSSGLMDEKVGVSFKVEEIFDEKEKMRAKRKQVENYLQNTFDISSIDKETLQVLEEAIQAAESSAEAAEATQINRDPQTSSAAPGIQTAKFAQEGVKHENSPGEFVFHHLEGSHDNAIQQCIEFLIPVWHALGETLEHIKHIEREVSVFVVALGHLKDFDTLFTYRGESSGDLDAISKIDIGKEIDLELTKDRIAKAHNILVDLEAMPVDELNALDEKLHAKLQEAIKLFSKAKSTSATAGKEIDARNILVQLQAAIQAAKEAKGSAEEMGMSSRMGTSVGKQFAMNKVNPLYGVGPPVSLRRVSKQAHQNMLDTSKRGLVGNTASPSGGTPCEVIAKTVPILTKKQLRVRTSIGQEGGSEADVAIFVEDFIAMFKKLDTLNQECRISIFEAWQKFELQHSTLPGVIKLAAQLILMDIRFQQILQTIVTSNCSTLREVSGIVFRLHALYNDGELDNDPGAWILEQSYTTVMKSIEDSARIEATQLGVVYTQACLAWSCAIVHKSKSAATLRTIVRNLGTAILRLVLARKDDVDLHIRGYLHLSLVKMTHNYQGDLDQDLCPWTNEEDDIIYTRFFKGNP